jgi:xylan 1,4-beta-xylosidase
MLGQMRGDRLRVDSSGAQPLDAIRDRGVREAADVSALASGDGRSVAILVWNYHDDDLPGPEAAIELTIDGLPAGPLSLSHDRVDANHSNAYEAWKRAGSPQPPTPQQYRALEAAGHLQRLEPPRRMRAVDGRARVSFTLPRQGVSLVRVSW